MAGERHAIRVLLLGDPKTGKTSLITTLLSEQFQEQVASVVPEVNIPIFAASDNIPTQLVDTSSWKFDRPLQEREIKKADVICLVYDVSRQETFDRITSYWLPLIATLTTGSPHRVPVLLVGNKIDLRRGDGDDSSDGGDENKHLLPIMDAFLQVETCIECSARAQLNVHELFHYARSAVLYPSDRLYDSSGKCMRAECVRALRRIFKICDRDNDGFLSDHELNQFQRRCFSVSLPTEELARIKEVIRNGMPSGVSDQGINIKGFLYVHHLFIQKGRLEATWAVLRRFGYGDSLQLHESYVSPPAHTWPVSQSELSKGHYRCELSHEGGLFFEQLFHTHDRDRDGALSEREVEDVFAACAPMGAWPSEWGKVFPSGIVATNDQGYITLQGWLSLWSATAALRPTTVLRYLAYLGFDAPSLMHALSFREKKDTSSNHAHVLRCYVIGPRASGKSAFLNRLVGKDSDVKYTSTAVKRFTVHQVDSKYLLMCEFGPDSLRVLQSERKMAKCDVLCVLYDSTHSLDSSHSPTPASSFSSSNTKEYLTHARSALARRCPQVPCLFIGTRADVKSMEASEGVRTRTVENVVSDVAQNHKLVDLNATESVYAIYQEIVREAQNPNSKYILGKCHHYSRAKLGGGLLLASIIIGMPLGCWYYLKYYRLQQTQ
eukprot:TRINITY_DN4747_c0_g1_i1.p1 TRINITY_DN4747_c0_g1~~TRINITY_DN4747_c0_g1_i1.p1  ORF type:complete len:664 (+),score=82.04 TRINITY_DN4747_c0_g1_i1:17-2008(+)